HSAGAKKLQGGLRLDSRAGLLQGGNTSPAIVPGAPHRSLLVRAVRYTDADLQMPPKRRLTRAQVADLEAWVKMGAPDPRGEAEGAVIKKDIDFREARRFWSLQPVRDPPLPAVKNRDWPRNPIDHFLLAALEARGLQPAGDADKRTLIRRATFDLTGLPPTPEEINAFLADTSSEAFAKVVDRLLDSPAYGERWGRHRLDLARYADTSGCNSDFPIPDAYRYRNYVIGSFNRDKPYDQFVREQIAGDLLPSHSVQQHHEQVIATGFLALSRRFGSDDSEFYLTLEDSIDTLGKSILGLSIGCARCHDHKFDPILNEDYYALYGILQSSRYAFPGVELSRWPRDLTPLVSSPEEEAHLRKHMDELAQLDKNIRALWKKKMAVDAGQAKKAEAEYKEAVQHRDDLVAQGPHFDMAFAVAEGKPGNARIQIKGDPTHLGSAVPRRFLRVLGGQELPKSEHGSGRRELAEWLIDPHNPLTARVMVNRIWLHHFGQGIVQTPNDFGTRGKPPTHPELLDYLASRFVEAGWSIKAMHRQIMLTHAYQLTSVDERPVPQADPNNDLLWKFPRRRLDAEEIRDAMLAVSGALDRSMGGPHPFPPEQTWRYTQHKAFVAVYDTNRRSVYLMQQRLKRHPLLEVFDGADPSTTTPQRLNSPSPLQALFLMNSPFAHTQADRFASRV
ncbi:MAG: PSD1 domain-containing protein, partial [Planctomycetes bacterium]|nr:PSD1 domain-containing protein [Planctomycetota bacterium]